MVFLYEGHVSELSVEFLFLKIGAQAVSPGILEMESDVRDFYFVEEETEGLIG